VTKKKKPNRYENVPIELFYVKSNKNKKIVMRKIYEMLLNKANKNEEK